jgi:17beta-estradiol 17-dehydrogenase / very-long-chain 3-oxoacyl-CoA reductase
MLATYSGSKAFLAAWSSALAEEYRCKGIAVQLVNTFFVVRPNFPFSPAPPT